MRNPGQSLAFPAGHPLVQPGGRVSNCTDSPWPRGLRISWACFPSQWWDVAGSGEASLLSLPSPLSPESVDSRDSMGSRDSIDSPAGGRAEFRIANFEFGGLKNARDPTDCGRRRRAETEETRVRTDTCPWAWSTRALLAGVVVAIIGHHERPSTPSQGNPTGMVVLAERASGAARISPWSSIGNRSPR